MCARLKSNSKQVCIDPKLKWIQEYLEKALNKGAEEAPLFPEAAWLRGFPVAAGDEAFPAPKSVPLHCKRTSKGLLVHLVPSYCHITLSRSLWH
ncbi:hypothetical protein IHE44_0001640 [Lamprotornis superbus]|uniref:Chemokine interleukin-8-like domain-containing protein n=1 Tax=Lamprotornis superbus TaxID=245042 RepID=A0A835NSP5_9PASS|nr:hypothetical protein IHE44_0001640 [Lamprotornis superbus]